MTGGKILGLLLGLVMLVAGGFVASAGMGYVGESGDTSTGWTVAGSVLAGFGVALVISLFQRRG